MSEVSIPLLAPIDADVLLSKGLAGPVTRTGVRRLHKRRLDSSSEEENATIPLCDVMGPDADIYMAYAELPADIFSEATLRHIGFEASVAALLWQRWVDWPTDPSQPSREVDDEIQGMPFIDFATGYVKGRHIDADASTLAAQHAPGHTVLYTGLSQWRIRDLFDQNNRVIPAPFYFAIDRYMALYYANYAKHRDGVGSVVIIHIAIPNSATERLDATERQTLYWPDPNWREVVWNSRRGDALPRRLSRFAVATLIIGTVASKPQSVYNRLDSPDLITERFVLKNRDGRNAVQYVFLEREGEEFLKEHGCRALTVFGLTAAENAEWEERERLSSN
ncbi:hypothetical protein NKR19_g9879 [Coniochaeta hoffmannii]|uniref:Uncharacterized protein n=1 Tax=Coniochaeta hoffmannii TaxID=91930 RepID=A0AA38R2A2_9PEZI|nr:hypothetical protein NKR19_g9879 [Coniochaeta hoffmannii]